MQFETYAASIAKISEVTRENGGKIGNAYKTILARLSRSKEADPDVTDEDRSNASKAYSSIGISLYNKNGEYRDINDTLDDLSEKWDKLTDAERNYMNLSNLSQIDMVTFIVSYIGDNIMQLGEPHYPVGVSF